MRLFHGSNMEIDKVDLSKCMPNKDFGCGFYTTLLEEQAWRMAQRRARIDGGIPTVTVYEVPDDLAERPDLNCRIFDDKPTIEWAIFIGLLIRQFSRRTIDAEYLKKEFDFGRLTNQYTFHTEKALQYLKKVGVMHDKSAAGND